MIPRNFLYGETHTCAPRKLTTPSRVTLPRFSFCFSTQCSPVSPGLSSVLQLLTGGSFASFCLTCFCCCLCIWGRRTGNYSKCSRWSHHPLKTMAPPLCKRAASVRAVSLPQACWGAEAWESRENGAEWDFLLLPSLVAQTGKNLPAAQDTGAHSLGQEDPLEKRMATHSGILAWRIPWTEEPGGSTVHGSWRVEHDWATNTYHFPCVVGDPPRAPQTRAGGLPWSFWSMMMPLPNL